jgi:STE24 endopeptidase
MSEMTATRIGAGWTRAATLLAFAAAWSVAAYFLWQTRVPSGLQLPDLETADFFAREAVSRAQHFERLLEINWILTQVALLVVFALYAKYGVRFVRESAAGRIGTGMLLAMLGFAIAWLVRLPFDIVALWWERRYGVLKLSYVDLILGASLGGWLALGFTFVALSIAVLIVMGIAGVLPRLWWIAAAPVFAGIAVLQTFVSPYLILDTRRLDDPQLVQAAERLQRAEGLSGIDVRVQKVHDYTPTENAFATGLGPSRKVFLWDTLLTGGLKKPEIEVVLAHEFGHLARDHLWKILAWFALLALPEAYLVAVVARRRGGMARPEAVPLALLVVTVFTLVTVPIWNVISRRYEAEADWMALEATKDPAAASRLFQHFGTADLSDPNPSTFSYVLFENHPTLLQRIAMAEAWKARQAAATRTRGARGGS